MGYHPETQEEDPGKVRKAVKTAGRALEAAVRAQQADPVGTALWPFLMAVELFLLLGYRVRGELWGVLLVLAMLKAHSWAVENSHRHPLLLNMFGKARGGKK